jgi:hypothetical protein
MTVPKRILGRRYLFFDKKATKALTFGLGYPCRACAIGDLCLKRTFSARDRGGEVSGGTRRNTYPYPVRLSPINLACRKA